LTIYFTLILANQRLVISPTKLEFWWATKIYDIKIRYSVGWVECNCHIFEHL